ncbi:MAG: translation initiation factor [Anaerolineae bacterium]
MDPTGRRLVYSTDPEPEPEPQPVSAVSPAQHPPLRLMLDRKGRRGKIVTVVAGFQVPTGDLKDLAKALRKACGAGGTVRDDAIEVQGDHRERVEAYLKGLGYKVKRVGG